MLHQCLPQTLTVEKLAQWITENSKNSFSHEEKITLTEHDIQEFEHRSSAASRALDRLKAVEDDFKHFVKKGTPVQDGVVQPVDITIPPTAGSDVLKARREHADKILEQGYQVETTQLYTIPWPEESQMVVMTIEGEEWPMYTKPMGKDQKVLYGELFAGTSKKKGLGLPDHMKVTGFDKDTNTLNIEVKENKTKLKSGKPGELVDEDPLGLDLEL
jgi:hypothetical protein